MTTPMSVYARVAGRYAIDATDEEDIDEFFLKIVPTLPEREREQILKELLAASGLPNPSVPVTSAPPSVIPLMPMESVPAESAGRRNRPSVREHDARPPHDGNERFAKEYKKHYARVVRFYARTFEMSGETAEELAQDVFLRFYNAMDEYKGEAEWAFLETIARSVAFNYIRASRTAKRSAPTGPFDDSSAQKLAVTTPDYAEAEQAALRRKRLYKAIATLPESHRLCLQLWLDGFKYDQIAVALSVSLDAVKSRLRDAKKSLRDELGSEEAEAALAAREAIGA